LVIVRGEDGGELAGCLQRCLRLVRPTKIFPVNPKDVRHPRACQGAKRRRAFRNFAECLSERRSLAATGIRSQRQDDRQFIENDGGVFDKHGVRKIGLGGKRNNAGRPILPSRFS